MSDNLSILMVNNSVSPLITMLIPSFLLEFAGRIISVFKKYTCVVSTDWIEIDVE